MVDYYKDNYKTYVTESAPPNAYKDLGVAYYRDALYFFENFQGYEDRTIGVEQKVSFEIDINGKKIEFVGIIDRIAEDENGIILYDHKSKSKFKSKAEREKYFRQLYIYAHAIKGLYGKYPYKLRFNMIRENKMVDEIFNQDKMDEALKWLSESVEKIYNDNEFNAKHDDFFCHWLCDVQDGICPYRDGE